MKTALALRTAEAELLWVPLRGHRISRQRGLTSIQHPRRSIGEAGKEGERRGVALVPPERGGTTASPNSGREVYRSGRGYPCIREDLNLVARKHRRGEARLEAFAAGGGGGGSRGAGRAAGGVGRGGGGILRPAVLGQRLLGVLALVLGNKLEGCKQASAMEQERKGWLVRPILMMLELMGYQ